MSEPGSWASVIACNCSRSAAANARMASARTWSLEEKW